MTTESSAQALRLIDDGLLIASRSCMESAGPVVASTALLTRWHQQFGPVLKRYFGRRGLTSADCDDLAQEVYLRLAQRTDLGNVKSAERYLHRVAANVLTDWRRYRRARESDLHQSIFTVPDLSDDRASQERISLGRDALTRLRTALTHMPERTQRVFALHHFDGLPYAEIARLCGIAVRTVEDHMARANAYLLSALEQPE